MSGSYLKVTYRQGKPLAAYLYFGRLPGDRVERSCEEGEGLVVDYASDGRAIGIEIVNPSSVSLEGINKLLARLHADAITPSDLRPLSVA